MILLPREHGAYGQLAFPIVTALVVAGPSTPAVAIAAATVAGFLAHEPAVVVLGRRGSRMQRNTGGRAWRELLAWTAIGVAAGMAAWLTMPAATRWSLLLPAVPATVLAMTTLHGREKSWYGEIASALAFSAVAVPMTLASGGSLVSALVVAVPFALLFVTSTLAVRVVILRVRGGGNARATAATRRAAFALAALATVALVTAVTAAALPPGIVFAAAPGLVIAVVVAARPPAPAHLRTLGWTLVAASAVTGMAAVITAAPY